MLSQLTASCIVRIEAVTVSRRFQWIWNEGVPANVASRPVDDWASVEYRLGFRQEGGECSAADWGVIGERAVSVDGKLHRLLSAWSRYQVGLQGAVMNEYLQYCVWGYRRNFFQFA